MIIDNILNSKGTAFSFEVSPPLKGNSLEKLFHSIETLMEFDPKYINITTHRSELIYRSTPSGLFQGATLRRRPGTVAVAAAIKNKFNVDVVPHILCSGYSKDETEYMLIDLNFLGIHDLLVLRGDKAPQDKAFRSQADGYSYACELQQQINAFNNGFFCDGSPIPDKIVTPFSYGVAGYPEKHEEALNLETDIQYLKMKVDAGAKYVVTQMFFDNQKYYDFVERCRAVGITVPIIPGIKPVRRMQQLPILAKTFRTDFPSDFVSQMSKCKNEEEQEACGIEWCTHQVKDLMSHGVPSVHFYAINATKQVAQVARNSY